MLVLEKCVGMTEELQLCVCVCFFPHVSQECCGTLLGVDHYLSHSTTTLLLVIPSTKTDKQKKKQLHNYYIYYTKVCVYVKQ